MFHKTCLLIASLLVIACTPSLTYQDFNRPIFFANQDPGYCRPCSRKHGLLVAIWPDGRILRAKSASTVGFTYYYGKLNNQDLAAVTARIQALYKSDIESPGAPVDSAYRDIWVFPLGVDPVDAPNYFYGIDYVQNFAPENSLEVFMQMEIINARILTWDQLPRFGPSIWGVWTLPIEQVLEHNKSMQPTADSGG